MAGDRAGRSRPARALAFAGAALGLALALLAAGALALSRGWQREALRAALADAAGRALDARVEIAALEGPLLPELTLRGVRIVRDGETPLALERLRVRLRPRDLLLARELGVEALELEGAELRLARDERGSWSLPLPPRPSPAQPGPGALLRGVSIRRVEVRESALRLVWGDDVSGGDVRAGLELTARDLAFPTIWPALSGASGELRLHLGPARVAEQRLAGDVSARLADGRLALEGEVSNERGRLLLQGTATPDPAGEPFSAELDLELRAAAPTRSGREHRIRVSGGISPTRFDRLRLEARALEVAEPGALLAPDVELAGQLDADLALDGPTSRPELNGRVVWRRPRIAGIALDELSSRVETHDAQLVATLAAHRSGREILTGQLALPAIESIATGPALLDLAGVRFSLAGSDLELALLAPLLPEPWRALRGRARVDLRFAGGRGLEGTLELAGVTLPGLAAPPLSGRAEFSPAAPGIRVESLELESGSQFLRASGALSAERLEAVEISARLDLATLGRLAALPAALEGELALRAELAGPLPRPRISAELESLAPLRIARFPAGPGPGSPGSEEADAGALRIDALRGRVDTRGARLEARLEADRDGRELARARLSLPYGPQLATPGNPLALPGASLELASHGLDLGLLSPFLPPPWDSLGGRVDVDVRHTGGRGSEGTLELAELSHPLLAEEVLTGRVELAPTPQGIGVKQLRLTSGDQFVEASGSLSRDRLEDVRVTAELELATLAHLAGDPAPLEGRLSLRAEIAGPPRLPRLSAHATSLGPVRVASQRLDSLAVEVESDGDRLHGLVRGLAPGAERLSVELSLPSDRASWPEAGPLAAAGATLDANAEGLDLSLLGPLAPRFAREPRGRADLTLRTRGDGGSLDARGSLEIHDGSLRVPALHQTFAPIRGRLRLADGRLSLDGLEIGEPGARARARGWLALAGFTPGELALDLELERFPVARAPALRSDLSGELTASGSWQAPRLEGRVALVDALATLAEAEDPALREIRIVGGQAEGAELAMKERPGTSSAFQRSALDLQLAIPRGSRVRGRGADLELEGALTLRKPAGGEPGYSGQVSVVRGHYRFHQRRFDARRGVARFDGGARPDPLLDIEATHRTGDVTIVLELSGRASEPTLRLTSEPPLPESDVLSYLLVGRPASEISASQSADFSNAATRLAAGALASELTPLVEDALPIDTLDVQIAETGVPEEVRVGKYLSDRVFVRYGRSFGPEPVDEAYVELQIDDHWSVESQANSEFNAGLDLIWSFDY